MKNYNNITDAEKELLHLADDMASAASTFNSAQGYDLFVGSRESFKETLHKILLDAYCHKSLM
jgi:hypothetical protein